MSWLRKHRDIVPAVVALLFEWDEAKNSDWQQQYVVSTLNAVQVRRAGHRKHTRLHTTHTHTHTRCQHSLGFAEPATRSEG